jgi:hypothetical protein
MDSIANDNKYDNNSRDAINSSDIRNAESPEREGIMPAIQQQTRQQRQELTATAEIPAQQQLQQHAVETPTAETLSIQKVSLKFTQE